MARVFGKIHLGGRPETRRATVQLKEATAPVAALARARPEWHRLSVPGSRRGRADVITSLFL